VREAPVRPLNLVAGERLGERPVGVAVAAGAGRDHDRRCRVELAERGDGVLAVTVRPQHEGALDGVAAAVSPDARCAADVDVGAPPERDRPGRESAQACWAVKDLPHALPVVEAVAQLKQLAAVGLPCERGEEPRGGLVSGGGRGVHGGHGGSRRARGRCCAAGPRWWSGGLVGLARRAVRGGPVGRGLGTGLTVGGLAAGEELDALGDDVDARRVAAVLGLELVEQQPAVDRDLAPRS
jgi:hypothetical protein